MVQSKKVWFGISIARLMFTKIIRTSWHLVKQVVHTTYLIDIPNHSFFDCTKYIIPLAAFWNGINNLSGRDQPPDKFVCRKDPQRWVSWNAANGDSCSCLHFWSPWSVSFTLSWTNEKRHISKERPSSSSIFVYMYLFYA